MRYETGRKDASCSKIMAVATDRFRADGVAASGLATNMSDAGLTNDAFYPHFQSKAELAREDRNGDEGATFARGAGRRRPGIDDRGVSVAPSSEMIRPAGASPPRSCPRSPARSRKRRPYCEGFKTMLRLVAAALPQTKDPEATVLDLHQ